MEEYQEEAIIVRLVRQRWKHNMVGTFVRAGIKEAVKKKTLKAGRIADINRKLRRTPDRGKILPTDNQPSNIKQDVFEDHIDEVKAIYDKYNKGKK